MLSRLLLLLLLLLLPRALGLTVCYWQQNSGDLARSCPFLGAGASRTDIEVDAETCTTHNAGTRIESMVKVQNCSAKGDVCTVKAVMCGTTCAEQADSDAHCELAGSSNLQIGRAQSLNLKLDGGCQESNGMNYALTQGPCDSTVQAGCVLKQEHVKGGECKAMVGGKWQAYLVGSSFAQNEKCSLVCDDDHALENHNRNSFSCFNEKWMSDVLNSLPKCIAKTCKDYVTDAGSACGSPALQWFGSQTKRCKDPEDMCSAAVANLGPKCDGYDWDSAAWDYDWFDRDLKERYRRFTTDAIENCALAPTMEALAPMATTTMAAMVGTTPMIVTGTLTLTMEAADAARFVEDDGAKEALKTGIAAVLLGVDATSVEIFKLALTDRRFLGPGRRLSGPTMTTISVRYIITVPKSKDPHSVAAMIAGATVWLKNEINHAMISLSLSYSVADLVQTSPVVGGQYARVDYGLDYGIAGKAAPRGGGLGTVLMVILGTARLAKLLSFDA